MTLLLAAAMMLQEPPPPPILKVWERELDIHILGAPVVFGDLAIVASRLGTVRAFKLETGELAWEYSAGNGPVSRLCVHKNQVFVPAWSRTVSLDAATGTLAKKTPFIAGRILQGRSKLYVMGGMGFNGITYDFVSSDYATCFDPYSGRQSWRASPSKGINTIVEGSGRVFLSSSTQLEAVDSVSGKRVKLADRATQGTTLHGLVSGSRLIFVQGGRKQVVCYDVRTLKELWTWSGDKPGIAGLIPPLVVGDNLVFFPLPDVVCIDPRKEGKTVWTLQLEGATPEYSDTPPTLREDEFTIGVNGRLMGVNVGGAATWTLAAPTSENPRAHQPVWAGDLLLYASGTKISCFKRK